MIRAWGTSDTGRVRAHNEDSFCSEPEAGMFVVADGMGGHSGGRTASTLAVQTLRGGIAEARAAVHGRAEAGLPLFADLVRRACEVIYRAALADAGLRGMGTTVTGLWLMGQQALVAHVGDSRCYLWRGGRLTQLTEDHSLVNEQVRAGVLAASEARASPMRNVITRSVGFEPDVAVDTLALPLEAGDRFLLCSDGLSNHLDDDVLAALLAPPAPPEQAACALVAEANRRGGDDNITAVVVLVDSLAPSGPQAAAPQPDPDITPS